MHKKIIIIFSIIVLCLIISNIFLLYKCNHIKEIEINEKVILRSPEAEFDANTEYFNNISYKNLKKLLKKEKTYTLAIIDKSSNTYNKFKEMINKISFYKNTEIYMLELNKLSKKDTIAFYELDESLSKLNNNYIITIKKDKVLSITTFEQEKINEIIEEMEQ